MAGKKVNSEPYEMYYSDNGSDTSHSSCECSDVNSNVSHFEWENEINDNGELFYIKSSPRKLNDFGKHSVELANTEKKTKTTASKLVRLLKRRKRERGRNDSFKHTGNTNKVTFLDTQEGEIREVTIDVGDDACSNLGRRATLSERLLGLCTTVFKDGTRVMVASTIPNSFVDNQRIIKIGDWLKIINGKNVTASTLDEILSSISLPTTVRLVVQRVSASLVDMNKNVSLQLSNYLLSKKDNEEFTSELVKCPITALYLLTDKSDAIYIFPNSSSVFNKIRGAFQTILHIVPQIVKHQVQSTSMLYNDQLVHVLFWTEGKGTLLFIVPNAKLCLIYAKWTIANIVRNLCFCYKNLNSCFTNTANFPSLDKYFSIVFSELLSINMYQNIVDLKKMKKYIPASMTIPLVRSMQMELDDILNEFEANYMYEDTREPRPYIIIGTSVYYKEYLLSTHLNYEDHLDIHMFCQQKGLFHLLNTEYLERLIIFQQVHPSSSRSNYSVSGSVYTLPKAKWYLLLVGRGYNLLATLLEIGHYLVTETSDGPCADYVEEAENTLENIINMNIDEFAEKWIEGNVNDANQEFVKNSTSNISGNNKTANGSPIKKTEITSILKHKNDTSTSQLLYTDSRQLDSLSETSLTSSGAQSTEDSLYTTQGPVLGRRAERMMKASSLEWSDYSDDDCTVSESSRSIDMPDGIKNSPTLSNKMSVNKLNMLYCYMDLNCHTGIMLCSPSMYNYDLGAKHIVERIEEKFNSTVTVIRETFNRCNQDETEINEVSVLFNVSSNTDNSSKKSSAFTFWVTGKLFNEPTKREIYVCYEDGTPQNMVEIAFKLGISAAG
ncbi:protein inturned isoform X2 [Adelges cooleyi]|uniref:protein inturned isoform X2 n=1 Tax=Adelges cooleyi TaxID=133065 RepID=UPI00217FFAD6|nr:protein inturned isoform X2 [Adelges cooleyi]